MTDPAARVTRAVATFDPMPSRRAATGLAVEVVASLPPGTTALAVPVGTAGEVPASLGLSRTALLAAGFSGAVGQAMPIPGFAPPRA